MMIMSMFFAKNLYKSLLVEAKIDEKEALCEITVIRR